MGDFFVDGNDFLIGGGSCFVGDNNSVVQGCFSWETVFAWMIAKVNVHFYSLQGLGDLVRRHIFDRKGRDVEKRAIVRGDFVFGVVIGDQIFL